jgi:uncharacterized protein YjdB
MKKKLFLTIALALCGLFTLQAQQKKVLYVVSAAGQQDPVRSLLEKYYEVTEGVVSNATTGTSVAATASTYDAVVISEAPGSGNLNAFKDLATPVLTFKGHALLNSRWGWSSNTSSTSDGTAIEQNNLALQTIVVDAAAKADPIYTGLRFDADTLKLLTAIGKNGDQNKGLMAIAPKVASAAAGSVVPAPASGCDKVVLYYAAGTTPDGSTTLSKDYAFIGISSQSMTYLTADAKQLIVNTVNKLIGLPVTGKEEMPIKVLYAVDNVSSRATDPLYNALAAAGYDIKTQIISTTNVAPDTAGVDVVLLSEYVGGNNAKKFENLSKPVFTMKGHTFHVNGSNRWGWMANNVAYQSGVATELYMSIADINDPLFAGVTLEADGSIKLITEVGSGKGLIGVSQIPAISTNKASHIGTITGATNASDTVMFYLQAGATVGAGSGVTPYTLNSDYFYLGITGNESLPFATKNFVQIASNALGKLTGTTPLQVPDVTLTVETPAGGSVSGAKTTYFAGERGSLTATPDVSYVFTKWEKQNGSAWDSVTNTATLTGLITENTTLRPVFTATTPPPPTTPTNKTNLKVGYVVKTEAQKTDSIFQLLNRNFTQVNTLLKNGALAAEDITSLLENDVIVIPSYFDGGNLEQAKNLSKPVLVMHAGALVTPNPGNTQRWGWVSSRNHAESVGYEQNILNQNSVEVSTAADKAQNLYKGLRFVGNTVRLLDSIVMSGEGGFNPRHNGLMSTCAPKTGTLKAVVKPQPSTGADHVIYYQAKGSLADGSNALNSNYCFIGIHSSSYGYLNQNAKQLIVNAVKTLADSVPAGTEEADAAVTPAVSSVSISKTTLSLYVPAVETLTASASISADKLADDVIRWSSSNPAVATVDYKGEVQAVSAGTATITATVADGTKTATCNVTVLGSAEVLLNEDFTDWELRSSKYPLAANDSAPTYVQMMLNDLTISRPLRGSATGNVEFKLSNVSVFPFLGSKYGNDAPGALLTSSSNNGASRNHTTNPNPATDPEIQGASGTVTAADGGTVTIGQIDRNVKTIEVVLSIDGEGRSGAISKSYDGVTWLAADADITTESEGRLKGFIFENQRANKYIINLPKAESNFFLRIGPGGNDDFVNLGYRFLRIHSVKYYAPNTVNIPVTGVSITGAPDAINLVAPQSWCEASGVQALSYACTPADATKTAVTWASTNPNVAAVDATGNVTPIGAGSAKIFVKTEDGNKTDTVTVNVTANTGSSSATCPDKVTVTKTWSTPYLELNADSSYQLAHTVTPADATMDSVVYASLSEFASVTPNGVVTGISKGWAVIVATIVTQNEGGRRIADTLDVRILPAVYVGGEPAPDAGAPTLPIAFNARTELSPTTQLSANVLNEEWAHGKWFDFSVTGLRAEKTNDSAQYLNLSRIQGVYINQIEENGATADFANIGLKTTKAAGRQTRLIFAYDGELDSLKLGIVVTGEQYPSTVAVQESNNAETWNDVYYIVNNASATKETEAPSSYTLLTPDVYTYPVIKGFSKNSRFIRLYQTESGTSSAVAHNIYLDGIWLYGGGGSDEPETPSGVSKEAAADYGIAVYPNPVDATLYVAGAKKLSKVEFIDLSTGAKVRSVALQGVLSAEVSAEGLPEGVYVVAIYVEGSSKPQVVKILKQ